MERRGRRLSTWGLGGALAASVAGLLLTTEAAVAEKPEKKAGAPASPGGGDYDEDY